MSNENTMAKIAKMHKLKWILPIPIYFILLLLQIPILQATMILIAYYFGSWTSETILSKLATQYMNEMKTEQRQKEDLKPTLYRKILAPTMTKHKRKISFWIEYTDEKTKTKGKQLIEQMGGKILADYPHIQYFYAEFPLKGIMKEEGILNTLILSGLFKNVRQDEKLHFFELEEHKLKNEDIIFPQNYLHLTEAEELRRKGYTGRGIKIGVIDSGVDLQQFKDKNIKPITKSVEDKFGHGTAVIDIITNIAPEAEIFVGKATTGDNYIDTRKAINLMEKMRKQKVDILNMSFGGLEEDDGSHPLAKEAQYLASQGILVVCAIGNNPTGIVSYPATAKDVISVGSVNKKDKVSWFSNYGLTVNGLKPEVLSYGENICVTRKGEQVVVSGTSFATPMVTGILALLKQYCTEPEKVKQAIFKTAEKKHINLTAKLNTIYCRIMKTIGINLEYLGLMTDEMKKWGKHGIVRAYKAYLYLKNKFR
jgi:hypothetical protein